MKKGLMFLALFYLALIIFMPRVNFYYTVVNALKSNQISVTQESLNDGLFSLKSDSVVISYDGIESVTLEELSLSAFIFYNKITASNVKASKSLQNMFKYSADLVEVTYVIWDFKRAKIFAKGDFGVLNGVVDLSLKTIKVVLEPSDEFKSSPLLRQYFKNSDEGYIYESKIN